jgi:BirA family biotin operon repressor/biotin-[acetyl-CoA-carboxylase] ligase
MRLLQFASEFDPLRRVQTPNRLFFAVTESTNTLGRRIVATFSDRGHPPPVIIAALEQTAGRGRLGKRWESPRGGLYVSLVQPRVGQEELTSLPMQVAVSLCRELDRIVDSTCRLKWPNDLLVRERKIGGILVESVVRAAGDTAVVVGFGINYQAVSGALAPGATSILEESSRSPTLPQLAARLVESLEQALGKREPTDLTVRRFAEWSLHREGQTLQCRTATGTVTGRFTGFDPRGFLRLETPDGERRIPNGEVLKRIGDH